MSSTTAGAGSRVALMLPAPLEDRLVGEIAHAGDQVVLRAATVSELIARAAAGELDLMVVQSIRGKLTPELIGSCELTDVTLLAVVSTDAERDHAASLHFPLTAAAGTSWADMKLSIDRKEPTFPQEDAALEVPASVVDAGLRESAKTSPVRRFQRVRRATLELRQAEASPSRVIAVWGPTGAPGRTSIAINLATELMLKGHRTLLVDADTYGGSIALALGLIDETPGIAAACRQAHRDAFIRDEFERVVQHVDIENGSRSQLAVLTGISRSNRWPEIAGDRVTSVLNTCREWFDVIVCDVAFNLETDEEITSDMFAPRRNMATLAVLAAADAVLEVTGSEPVSLARYLRAHQDFTDAFPHKPGFTVANRVRPGAQGMNPGHQVTHTLERFSGVRNPLLLPFDEKTTELMALKSAPAAVAAPKSKLRQGYEAIADRVSALQISSEKAA
jgi:MinD-like ATPase involved in chromosome partitioning or flagellar assembly